MHDQEIGWTAKELKHGTRVRRRAWDKSQFLCLVPGVMLVPDSTSAVRRYLPPAVDLKCGSHVILCKAAGVWEPWSPMQPDILASDWEVYEEPP
jgi:hypothetical protein